MSKIRDLWKSGRVPILSALYRYDDVAIYATIDNSVSGGLRFGQQVPLTDVLAANTDYLASLDITHERQLPHDEGFLVCGEGSYGSDGFFGLLDSSKELVWVVFLENSNPFVSIFVNSRLATFTSSSGITLRIDLNSSEFVA